MLAGDVVFNYNGTDMKVRDCPDAEIRKFMGVGHFTYGREAIEGDWPYTPGTCEYADAPDGWWDREGTVLFCPGCGLDCT